MLESKDLRIGNYYLNEENKLTELSGYYLWQLSVKEHHKSFNQISKEFKPIPISEEWLIRFGFKKDDNGNFWVDLQTHYFELMICSGGVFPTYVQIQEFSHELEQRVNFNSINYIHQLQNMYYCLTGKELELKS